MKAICKGSRLGCFLGMTPSWWVSIRNSESLPHLIFSNKNGQKSFDVTNFHFVSIQKGLLWSKIDLRGKEKEVDIQLPWLWSESVGDIVREIEHYINLGISKKLNSEAAPLNLAYQQIESFLNQRRYIRNSDVQRFNKTIPISTTQTLMRVNELLSLSASSNSLICGLQ